MEEANLIANDPQPPAPDPREALPTPRQGTRLVFLVLLLLLTVGSVAQTLSVYPGLLLTELGLLLLPTLLLCRWLGVPWPQVLKWSGPGDGTLAGSLASGALVGLLAFAMAIGLTVPVVLLLLGLGGEYPGLPLPLTSSSDYLWALGAGALAAPLCEESLFRGFLLTSFRGASPHAAVWAVGIAFGLFHLDPVRFVPTMALGVVYGYLTFFSGTLWPAVLAHAVNNGMALTLGYLGGAGQASSQALSYETLKTELAPQLSERALGLSGWDPDSLLALGLATAAVGLLVGGIVLALVIGLVLRQLSHWRRREMPQEPAAVPLWSRLRRDPWVWGMTVIGLLAWTLSAGLYFSG